MGIEKPKPMPDGTQKPPAPPAPVPSETSVVHKPSAKFLALFEKCQELARKRAHEILKRPDRALLSLLEEAYMQALFDLAEADALKPKR